MTCGSQDESPVTLYVVYNFSSRRRVQLGVTRHAAFYDAGTKSGDAQE